MSKECYYCGCSFHEDEGQVRFDEVQVGRMGSSWTIRGGGSATASKSPSRRGSGSAARNSGRKLYKTLRVWACNECNARIVKWNRIKFWTKAVIYSAIIGGVVLISQPLWKVKLPNSFYEVKNITLNK